MPALKNPRHELFALYRARGMSLDEAYQQAGFTGKRQNASRLAKRKDVEARIDELMAHAVRKQGIELEEWLQMMLEIARGNILDLYEQHEDGYIQVADLKALPIELQRLVQEVDCTTTATTIEGITTTTTRVKVKTYSRQKALEAIGRFLGAFERDNIQRRAMHQHAHLHTPAAASSSQELAQRREQLLKRITG